MKRVQLFMVFVVASVVFSVGQPAYAQPRQGTLSPWLNMFGRNRGPLGPYLSDVRPEQQLQTTLQQHGAGLQQHDARLQRQHVGMGLLGQQMINLERTGTIRSTGTGGGFMNYSHYYQFPGMAAGRRSMQMRAPPMGRGRATMSHGAQHR